MNLLEEIAQELDKGAPWILYRQDLAAILRRVAAHHQQPAAVECSCPHMDMNEPASNHSSSCPGRQPQQPAPVSDYIATVPDNCDRIIWRGQYHHLPTHQPAPVVDDALVDAAIAAQDAHWANDDNYPARAPRSVKGDARLHDKLARGAMRAALTAALARAQGAVVKGG